MREREEREGERGEREGEGEERNARRVKGSVRRESEGEEMAWYGRGDEIILILDLL